ncbi:LLM class F420-dependent oxidoreductase [Trujillonella endophytica]|uniref:Probable F420-dependent oxidoreductase, Rv2161c family n=1 Tax=Trujillonella endophytica TaxID=673521 RepID=A0A1H8QT57_9ACTN|nr:LLM class F420-dependent oxidoreductase [Trujillella endophytica]SEO57034.1 probable F420-dependent oxidoreductase, Rv2161c family [Trujillella endophytica]
MKTGVLSMNTDEDPIPPLELARLLEDSGIESIFVPDHSHVPVGADVPEEMKVVYGGEEEKRDARFKASHGGLQREYYHNYDQLTTLTAMAAVTTTLKVGTGICLVVQRDPFFLAKQIATLDHFSGGRLIFGVGAGAGWNAEELENHGVVLKTRWALMLERVEAMKAIWTTEKAEYHGDHVDFKPLFSWPKPITQPHPPVLMGGMGPTVVDRALSHADGWLPGHTDDTFDGLGDRITELRERAAAEGRTVDVTLNFGRLDFVDQYHALGVDRVLYSLPTPTTATESEIRQFIKDLSKIAQEADETSPAPAGA